MGSEMCIRDSYKNPLSHQKYKGHPQVTTTHENITTIQTTINDNPTTIFTVIPSPSSSPSSHRLHPPPSPLDKYTRFYHSSNQQTTRNYNTQNYPYKSQKHHVKETTAGGRDGRLRAVGRIRPFMSLPLAACACVTFSSHYQISHGH